MPGKNQNKVPKRAKYTEDQQEEFYKDQYTNHDDLQDEKADQESHMSQMKVELEQTKDQIDKLTKRIADMEAGEQHNVHLLQSLRTVLHALHKRKLTLDREIEPKTSSWLDKWGIIIVLLVVFSLMCFSKLNEEFYARFAWGNQVNLYEVLELAPGATPAEIKAKYRDLAMKFHPDKHPDCSDCTAKFAEIQNAYEVLGDPQKREVYDESNGILNFIRSSTIELSWDNFDRVIADSGSLWFIQVYENGIASCEHFGHYWEELHKKHPLVKLARINFKSQKSLLRRLPFGVNELPMVMHMGGTLSGEFLELKRFGDQGIQLFNFVEKALEKELANISLKGLSNTVTVVLKDGGSPIDHLVYAGMFADLFGVKTEVKIDKQAKHNSVSVQFNDVTTTFKSPMRGKTLFELVKVCLFYHGSTPVVTRELFESMCQDEPRCLLMTPKLSTKWKDHAREDLRNQLKEALDEEGAPNLRKFVLDFNWDPSSHPKTAKMNPNNHDFVLYDPVLESLAVLDVAELQTIEDAADVESDKYQKVPLVFGAKQTIWGSLRPAGFSLPVTIVRVAMSHIFGFTLTNLFFIVLLFVVRRLQNKVATTRALCGLYLATQGVLIYSYVLEKFGI